MYVAGFAPIVGGSNPVDVHVSVPLPSLVRTLYIPVVDCALGIVTVYDVVTAAGLTVRFPEVNPLRPKVYTFAKSFVDEIVTVLFLMRIPVVSA